MSALRSAARFLFGWWGTVDRRPYALAGVVAFAAKNLVDRGIARLFDARWDLESYVDPFRGKGFAEATKGDRIWLYFWIVVASLPFAWMGIVLTVKRLRSVGLPRGLVLLFFVPIANVLAFVALSVLPEKETPIDGSRKRLLDRVMPYSEVGSAAFALIIPTAIGALFFTLGTKVFRNYGFGLFLGLPFAIGLLAPILHGYRKRRTLGESFAVAAIAIVLLALLLLAIAFEGLACILMALPLALPLAILGACLGHFAQQRARDQAESDRLVPWVAVTLPVLLLAESAADLPAPLFEVRTEVEIAAPPERVWEHVVAFCELPPPAEWYFRTGIAYPMRAEISGSGPGAMRRCVFSTGAFLEPIEVWDAPKRLAFSVAAQPAPMEEWTPYGAIDAPHLHGYLTSERGEFLLTALPNGGTRLEGITWYRHHLWPASYWRLIADAVIHRIHLRVLRHVRALSESAR